MYSLLIMNDGQSYALNGYDHEILYERMSTMKVDKDYLFLLQIL